MSAPPGDRLAGARPVTIPRAVVRELTSSRGRGYDARLAWPEEEAPPEGFPVIYLLDAEAAFATTVEAVRMRSRRPDATAVVPAIVVGIGYGSEGAGVRARRLQEYTPPANAELLEFLDDEVKPEVERTFPIDRTRQSLLGHSLGGLFVVQALLSRPAAFRTYVAVSPSLWRDRDAVFTAVGALQEDPARPLGDSRVLITVGEYEQTLAPWQVGQPGTDAIAQRRRDRQMVDDARRLAARLDPLAATVRFELFAGEDHASVVTLSISKCLRLCLAP